MEAVPLSSLIFHPPVLPEDTLMEVHSNIKINKYSIFIENYTHSYSTCTTLVFTIYCGLFTAGTYRCTDWLTLHLSFRPLCYGTGFLQRAMAGSQQQSRCFFSGAELDDRSDQSSEQRMEVRGIKIFMYSSSLCCCTNLIGSDCFLWDVPVMQSS